MNSRSLYDFLCSDYISSHKFNLIVTKCAFVGSFSVVFVREKKILKALKRFVHERLLMGVFMVSDYGAVYHSGV